MQETLFVEGLGNIDVHFTKQGSGRQILLLHGGGGPSSVAPWAELLAKQKPACVIAPTLPGIAGTPRPEALTKVVGLARVFGALLDKLEFDDVSVMGHSIGGWIAAEMAIATRPRISTLVLVDAVGIEVPEHPAADVFAGEPRSQSGRVLKMYAGNMMDPTLRSRLSVNALPPTLVVWGAEDEVVDYNYGNAYAKAIRGAEFKLLQGVGHGPPIESPGVLTDVVWPFVVKHARD